jgi:hypothetical protein
MSQRAREFLEHWKAEFVGAVADNQRLREAVRLVLRCREDATCAGIPPHELRTAAQEDLIRNMLAAIDAAAGLRSEPEPQAFLPRLLGHLRIGKSSHHRALAR